MARNTQTIAGIELTANEIAAISNFHTSQYFDGANAADFIDWSFEISNTIQAYANISAKSATEVMSSLSKKGLLNISNERKADERTVSLTDAGLVVCAKLLGGEVKDLDELVNQYLAALRGETVEPEPEPEPELDLAELTEEEIVDEISRAIGSQGTLRAVLASEIKPSDQILGYTVGRVTVGRVRTTVWAQDGTELLYTLNNMNVLIVPA